MVEVFETDLLCVGGGIAGLMAATRAAELGAKVIVAEKANTQRSGAAGTGNDHFQCYIPEVHGQDIELIVNQLSQHPQKGNISSRFLRAWMSKSFDIVKLWDSWGIPMKYHGRWEFAGHGLPGRPLVQLKYAGKEQKPILTREAAKRGVKIINRVMINELLSDGSKIYGAIGTDLQGEKTLVIKSRSTLLGTGGCQRLYPSSTPGWMFNRAHSPSTTGDGRAMAYRAGAELFNMEIPRRWAGLKYFARCGKGSWVGVIRDPDGKAVGPFVSKPDKKLGDAISDHYFTLFEDYTKSGKGPVYMDTRGISDEDLDYMNYWLGHEGNAAVLNQLEQDGIDLRKNAVEFSTYEITCGGGIPFNEKGETSLKGLYAAGDEYYCGISGAAVFGWLAAENAFKLMQQTTGTEIEQAQPAIEKYIEVTENIRRRETGIGWQEANIALGQVMQDYAGPVRSQTMLEAGLSHLRKLREKTGNSLSARNSHELMRCLEVLNLFEMGELVFLASIERKESRGRFMRPDYPFTNPLLNNKTLICKKIDDKPVVEWK